MSSCSPLVTLAGRHSEMPAPTPTPTLAPAPAPAVCALLRSCTAHLFSSVGLCALVAAYALAGAALFELLEADVEVRARADIRAQREHCVQELWAITERLNVLYEHNWTTLVHRRLRHYEAQVVSATRGGSYVTDTDADIDRQWTFSGALLYSVTVITTIGYGNLAPRTASGKVVTMLYAVVGVPLMLLCLSTLGDLLADTCQCAYAHACCQGCATPAVTEVAEVKVTEVTETKEGGFRKSVSPHPVNEEDTNTVTIQPRSRPLAPEVRQLLTECAEYTMSQGGDPVSAMLLQELRSQEVDEEVMGLRSLEIAHDLCEEEDVIELSEADLNTPSKMPLICHQSQTMLSTSTVPTNMKSVKTTPTEVSVRVPVSIVLLVLTGYICLGATVFATWEEWTFLDGAYFCFITLSTIGFGDLVPGKSLRGDPGSHGGQLQLVVCCAYLLLGLLLIAAAFSLVQEEVVSRCRQLAVHIGIIPTNDR